MGGVTDRRNPWPVLGLAGWGTCIAVWAWKPTVAAVIAATIVVGAPAAVIAAGRAGRL